MNSLKKDLVKLISFTILCSFLAAILAPGAYSQSVPDSMTSQMDRMRALEIEIVQLENQLAEAQAKVVENIRKVKELDYKINACYVRMDKVENEIKDIRQSMNNKVRDLYMDGRKDSLVDILCADDVTDFLASVDRMIQITTEQSRILSELNEKRDDLEEQEAKLAEYKSHQEELIKSSDIDQLSAQLDAKRNELANITASLIQNEPAVSYSPDTTNFDPGNVYQEPDEDGFVRTGQIFSGYSSWYGNEFHGRPTASGEIFNEHALTCAHKTLPFGTWLKVTFRGKSVICRVNDRGPFVKGRMLDLSRGSAEAIGLSGVQWVDCEIVIPK